MRSLAESGSLYLRQHAEDPVAWRAWSDEAFAEAAERDVPVFLSVGYSACHWCHVMQRESFRDPGIAEVLNGRFVPIKVDREQRPDVDAVYMDYVAATTGGGGWPMSVFLTPERLPVLGGTYFPVNSAGRLPSFGDVLTEVDRAYREDRERLAAVSREALDFLGQMAAPKPAGLIDSELVRDAAHALLLAGDRKNGGFGTAPKFPHFSVLLFLARFAVLQPDREVLATLERSAAALVRGGIFDQAGGGICRYAVDEAWTVPHFEKMLPDNALLLRALAAIEQVAPREEWGRAALATAAWLDREMRLDSGAYASGLSADAAGVEGSAYVWTAEGLAEALDPAELRIAAETLGASGEPHLGGAYVLTRREGRGDDAPDVDAVLAKLLAARAARPAPERDGKAVVSWNAIAARGLIEAGRAFGDEPMTARGLDLARMLLERTRGGVPHVLDDPDSAPLRFAEDHAHLAAALLAAHAAEPEGGWLDEASRVHADTLRLFLDGDVIRMTPETTELPVRPREQQDEPVPSGASMVAENAVALARATGDESHRDLAQRLLARHWAAADYAPQTAGCALGAMAELLWA